MTARFDKITLIDVANMRTSHLRGDAKSSWKYIGEELNLTASELKAIRKSTSYRITAGEVLSNYDINSVDAAKTFGVEAHLANSIVIHAENAKAEAEARKAEMEVEVEATTEETTETTKVETKTAPTTDELTEKLEAVKAKYNEIFDTDFDKDNEVAEVATSPTAKASDTYKVFYTSTVNPSLIEGEKVAEFEASSPREAKKMTVRAAKKAGIVKKDEKFVQAWMNYSHKGFWLRGVQTGSRGFAGGLCLMKVA